MKFYEIFVIIFPIVLMFSTIIHVVTGFTLADVQTIIAIIMSGLISWMIAYYFHRKDTPAQRIWNHKRRETLEDLLELFEQLSRNIRVGVYHFEKNVDEHGHSKQLVNAFVNSNQSQLGKIQNLIKLIYENVERNYNYLTNKETRKYKMEAQLFWDYFQKKLNRPENYLSDIAFFENPRHTTQQLTDFFAEVDGNKEFLKRGVFTFHKSDLDGRWENTHSL